MHGAPGHRSERSQACSQKCWCAAALAAAACSRAGAGRSFPSCAKRCGSSSSRCSSSKAAAGARRKARPQAAVRRQQASSRRSNAFNPAISLILNGVYANLAGSEHYRINGFVPTVRRGGAGAARLQPRRIRARLHGEHRSTCSGQLADRAHARQQRSRSRRRTSRRSRSADGFTLKAGRFFSGIGYLNEIHQHAWDFQRRAARLQGVPRRPAQRRRRAAEVGRADRPLRRARRRGRPRRAAFPAATATSNGAGVGSAVRPRRRRHRRRAQLARGPVVPADARRRTALTTTRLARHGVTNSFTGTSKLWIADGVLKWAPNGNAHGTNFKLQGEYFRRKRERRRSPTTRRRARRDRRLLRSRAVRLVPAGRLPVHAAAGASASATTGSTPARRHRPRRLRRADARPTSRSSPTTTRRATR